MKKIESTLDLGGKKLSLRTGDLAGQATSAVMAQYGETVVLAAVVAAPLAEWPGYAPLSIEYQERLYAGGKIKGSRWVKREGKPSDEEVLTGRIIDRSIRPLFPKNYRKDVQITVTVLSVDLENPPDIVAAVAVSAALEASPIAWGGPVATIRVGKFNGDFVTNPTVSQTGDSNLDLLVSTTKDAIVMIEAGAKQVTEDDMLSAIEYAQKEGKTLLDFIKSFAEKAAVKKESIPVEKLDFDFAKKIKDVKELITKLAGNEMTHADYDEYKKAVIESYPDEDKIKVSSALDEYLQNEIRKMILAGKRPDGRKVDEIRPLSASVEVLPRTHGSAIFQRGQTQVLTVVTLGPPSLEQLIESAEGEESKRYIHHYSMPPYSVGETGRVGSPSRREIGHGALAERALIPVIPSDDAFPYTIRVVSEVLSSNGSTSMASTCASTLSLMDAGVPLIKPVSGIAMGLVIENKDNFKVLTDIVGFEDANGDMDFKIAGTEDGITALQLDVKTLNLTLPILKEAFAQAKKARTEILKVMLATLAEPRAKVSTHAPKIKVIKINPEKIGELIGPGGKIIKGIIAETGAQVDVEEDGTVNISGLTGEEVDNAFAKVEAITKEIQAGEIYEGVVQRIESFGAFVEIAPGRSGMVHVSDMSEGFVKNPADLVKIGQKVSVRVKEIDNLGRINLSMNMDPSKDKKEDRGGASRDRDRGPRRGYDRGGGFERGRRTSGPHFPTSRFIDTRGKDFKR
jgi:polyribonucleotide nucleotidyltransferase